MIIYNSQAFLGITMLVHGGGSGLYNCHVLPLAIISAITAACLSHYKEQLRFFNHEDENPTVYFGSFGILVNFIVIFRTQYSLARLIHGKDYYINTISRLKQFALFAGSFDAICDSKEKKAVNLTILRWLRLYHTLFVKRLRGKDVSAFLQGNAIKHNLCTNEELAMLIESPFSRLEIILSWMTDLIMVHKSDMYVDAPERVMLHKQICDIHDTTLHCIKFAEIPFPFVYAQLATVACLVWAAITPLFFIHFLESWLATLLTFFTVLFIAGLNESASRMENPFDDALNNLPLKYFTAQFNREVLLLANRKYPVNSITMQIDKLKISIDDNLDTTSCTKINPGNEALVNLSTELGSSDDAEGSTAVEIDGNFSESRASPHHHHMSQKHQNSENQHTVCSCCLGIHGRNIFFGENQLLGSKKIMEKADEDLIKVRMKARTSTYYFT